MARENFDAAFAAVIKHEGGYVDHPKDPGGATNLGITIGTLSQWLGRPALKAEVKALTVAKVKPIYRKNYWEAVKCDDLPSGLDYAVFDFAVNSGPTRAAIFLQNIVRAAPDGKVGPLTIKAVQQSTTSLIVKELCDCRLAFLKQLSTWPTFGKGWKIRVDGVRKMALEMADAAPKPEETRPKPTNPDKAPSGVIAAFVAAAIAAVIAILKQSGVL